VIYQYLVVPAKAGTQGGRAAAVPLDPRFGGGDDDPERKRTRLGRAPSAKKGSSRAAPPLAPSVSGNGYSASAGAGAGGTTET
jgi:hypothetical protein